MKDLQLFEHYIFLGILVFFMGMFLACKEAGRSCLCFMGIMVLLGLMSHFLGAYYFGYIMIFLGLAGSVVMLSFNLMLTEKNIVSPGGKSKREKIVSGVFLALLLWGLCLILKKNEHYFGSRIVESTMHKNIFGIIRDNYFVPMSLMMILIFVALVCINVIVKKEE